LTAVDIATLPILKIPDPRYNKRSGFDLVHQSSLTIASFERAAGKVEVYVTDRWQENCLKKNKISSERLVANFLDYDCDSNSLKNAIKNSHCVVFNKTPLVDQIESSIEFGGMYMLWPWISPSDSNWTLVKNDLQVFTINDSLANSHTMFKDLRMIHKDRIELVVFWDDFERNGIKHLQKNWE
jgi:hypothetical protein